MRPWRRLDRDDRIAIERRSAPRSPATNGGGGGALGWLHNFDADSLAGVAGRAPGTGDGTLDLRLGQRHPSHAVRPINAIASTAKRTRDGATTARATFNYAIEAAGVDRHILPQAVRAARRQADQCRDHARESAQGGTLLSVESALPDSVSYSYSVSGNLGTRLTAARIDDYGAACESFWPGRVRSGLAGRTVHRSCTSQLGATRDPWAPAQGRIRGVSKPLPHLRSELTLVGDYQDLSGSKHAR